MTEHDPTEPTDSPSGVAEASVKGLTWILPIAALPLAWRLRVPSWLTSLLTRRVKVRIELKNGKVYQTDGFDSFVGPSGDLEVARIRYWTEAANGSLLDLEIPDSPEALFGVVPPPSESGPGVFTGMPVPPSVYLMEDEDGVADPADVAADYAVDESSPADNDELDGEAIQQLAANSMRRFGPVLGSTCADGTATIIGKVQSERTGIWYALIHLHTTTPTGKSFEMRMCSSETGEVDGGFERGYAYLDRAYLDLADYGTPILTSDLTHALAANGYLHNDDV